MTRLNIPLFVALAASILSAVPANGRETLPHQRMIRKRGPSIGNAGPIGAAAVIGLHVRQLPNDPTGSASQSASSTGGASSSAAAATPSSSSTAAAPSSSSAPTSSAAATPSPSSSSSAAASSTSSGGLLGSLTEILASSSSSTVASTSTTPTSSPTPVSTTTTQPAQAPQTSQTTQQQPAVQTTPTLNIATPSPTARNPSVSVIAITSTQAAAEASASAEAQAKKTQKITRNTIISLVVIASCIGGAIAIWTVIRKWKLSPSEKFDDRMQPIDWAPPPAGGAAEDAIEEKSKHRRVGSGASHGSFTSGGVGQSEQGHGTKGGMYADSQYSHGYGHQPQDFPPPHDFTAGATQAGGYGQYYGGQQYAGGPGYADLQRGPSVSESNYSHGASVTRGMSYSRGHGAYDSQSGAMPPMPNPYGGEYGYDDYNHVPAGQQPQAQGQAPYRQY